MAHSHDDRGEPSELELQVLSVLWQHGPGGVRDVLAAMPDGKARAYTTILTVLQGLERKGLVRHEQRGRHYVYHPAASREGVLRPRLRRLVRHVFGGRPAEALQEILGGLKVTPEDLAAMRRILVDHERQIRRPPKGDEE